MAHQQTHTQETKISEECSNIIGHLQYSLKNGTYWAIAILEAIAQWPLAEEYYQGDNLHYLIENEAFDWRLLATRLSTTVETLIPEAELGQLSSNRHYPSGIEESEFRRLIGPDKYRAHLNFWYGIQVEEALIKAVTEEIIKEHRARSLSIKKDYSDEAYFRIYGEQKKDLLNSYKRTHPHFVNDFTSFGVKSFTYWLFKYRINTNEPARVASDTRKGLEYLQHRLHQH
jgi:hypothetical protein